VTLFAHESGSGGPLVVLLHGFGGTHRIWTETGIAGRLGAKAEVLAYDLPGHGRSVDFPDAGPAKVAAKAVLADLAARGARPAHLVGHSMGGAIALLAAIIDPARVASLTLLSPGGFGPQINAELLRRYAAAGEREVLRACLAEMAGPDAGVNEAVLEALLVERQDPLHAAKLAEIAAFITRDGRQGEIPRAMMEDVDTPVSVVWGDRDAVLPVEQAEGLPPAFALHVIPGCGHMIPEEAPELALRIIARNAGIDLMTSAPPAAAP
jgi:pimeloyl-ACP methyl ester carboxylesterase